MQRAICQTGFGQKILTILQDEKPLFFRIQRDNMLNCGEIISGHITKKNTTLRGYFIETAKKLPVFVPTQTIYTEGESVFVEITKEARLGKDATGRIIETQKNFTACLPDITDNLPKEILSVTDDKENLTDSLIEEALETTIHFADGAQLHIERTQCCWCLDIDSASSLLPIIEINERACSLIAAQIILKNLSGIILIDFAGFKTHAEQVRLTNKIKNILQNDKRTQIQGFSRTKLFEITRTRTTASLFDLFYTPNGQKHPAGLVPIIMRQILQCKKGHITLVIHPALLSCLPENIYTYCTLQPDLTVSADYFEIKGDSHDNN